MNKLIQKVKWNLDGRLNAIIEVKNDLLGRLEEVI